MNERKPIFVVDAMYRNLAKKLRLLGYDSLYYTDIDDDKILQIAKNENRILLTSDIALVKRSLKQNVRTVQITKKYEMEQILEINQGCNLGKCIITGNNSRCPLCNGVLHGIQKELIVTQVPEGVLKQTNEFWTCENCKKLYWEGTHIKNLQKFASILNELL
ncbi:MAG: Mut7-C RNAse domain-containing protein [Nitrosopumilaceae archaeon]